jgi:hypothetical protein
VRDSDGFGRVSPEGNRALSAPVVDKLAGKTLQEIVLQEFFDLTDSLVQQKQADRLNRSSVPYEFRGGIKDFVNDKGSFEVMLAGPAETGKTFAACYLIDRFLREYDGAQGVLMRKTYSSLKTSVLRTYLRIIGWKPTNDGYVRARGGESPEWFEYGNGSRLWIAGLDNAQKVLSSERDFFYINQAEELTETEWETITTRATGRASVMPFTKVMGDCNPGQPSHWIKTRTSLKLYESRHEDNPTLFYPNGEITSQGRRTLAILDNLTGVRYQRLRLGKWVQAEGVVYEEWDRVAHIIPRHSPEHGIHNGVIPENWSRVRSVDFGFKNPFVTLWGAKSPDDIIYIYRQIYRTGRTVKEHAGKISAVDHTSRIEATVCDHDAEDRETLRECGIYNYPAKKAINVGIQAVETRLRLRQVRDPMASSNPNSNGLRPHPDGRRGIYFLEDSLVDGDEALIAARAIHCTEQEFEVYSWPKTTDGKPIKEVPVDKDNHGMDALRYLVMYWDSNSTPFSSSPTLASLPYSSFGDRSGINNGVDSGGVASPGSNPADNNGASSDSSSPGNPAEQRVPGGGIFDAQGRPIVNRLRYQRDDFRLGRAR